MEYLLALIPALAWGSIGLISAKFGGSSEQKTLGSMSGLVLFACILSVILKPNWNWHVILVGVVSGAFLSAANFGQFDAMTEVGVSKSLPIVASGQLSLNVFMGALVFGEWETVNQWLLGCISLSLVIAGAIQTSYQEKDDDAKQKMSKRAVNGLIISVMLGALYAIVPKYYQFMMNINGGLDFALSLILPQALGGFFGAWFIYALRNKKLPIHEFKSSYVWKNVVTGLAWAIGNVFLLRAAAGPVGLATAFTFSQLNLVFGGIGGIVLLKEQKTSKELKRFYIGLVSILLGAFIISRI